MAAILLFILLVSPSEDDIAGQSAKKKNVGVGWGRCRIKRWPAGGHFAKNKKLG